MRNNCIFFTKLVVIAGLLSLFSGCFSPTSKKSQPESGAKDTFALGSYGYDLAFLQSNQIDVIELSDAQSGARVLLASGYQGRVMTSSAAGNGGISFGWINYKLIASGEVNPQFNPVGGEERFWLGPEGGPFSLYFEPGKEQVYANWKVPVVIDTARFDVKEQSPGSVSFVKQAVLKNASGSEFSMEIERQVTILPIDSLMSIFSIPIPDSLNIVAYQTTNTITNNGKNSWTKKGGLPSVWMLCMFNPTPSTTVFIPYRAEASGDVVRDDYFGKVPVDRLKVENGMIWFRIDGKLRSKIGVPPGRATSLCGSYDADQQVLTLLWCSLPETPAEYVNSKWGGQADPFSGDVVNSYNDGPLDDGSIMGPFYEIETSSPAAALSPGESITHIQRIVHLQGDTAFLAPVVKNLFGVELKAIASKFN